MKLMTMTTNPVAEIAVDADDLVIDQRISASGKEKLIFDKDDYKHTCKSVCYS
jgi:hypothetical protein